MAFDPGLSAKQTAYNIAGSVVSAAITAKALKFEDAMTELNRVAGEVFNELKTEVKADSGGGGKRRSGGGNSGGGGSKRVTLQEARDTEIAFGVFGPKGDEPGLTLAEIMALSREQAEEYGYEKSGRDYIRWLSKNERNKFMAKRAAMLIDAARSSEQDDDEPLDDEE